VRILVSERGEPTTKIGLFVGSTEDAIERESFPVGVSLSVSSRASAAETRTLPPAGSSVSHEITAQPWPTKIGLGLAAIFPVISPVRSLLRTSWDQHQLVALLVAFLEDPLSGNAPGQGIGHPAFAGQDDTENPLLWVAQSVHLAHGGGQIGQVFQDVDSQNTIKVAIGEIQPVLAVAGDSVQAWEPLGNLSTHVLLQF